MPTKNEWREKYLKLRTLLDENEVEHKSREIEEHLFGSVSLKDVKVLHVFHTIPDRNEVQTAGIINRLFEEYPHIRLATSRSDLKKRSLEAVFFDQNTFLRANKWGIPEPMNGEVCYPQDIDLVLVPLLICDVKGNRVGYGLGFYDSFLATCKPETIRIGLSLFPPVEAIENVDAWDIPMNGVVSPEGHTSF